LLHLRRQAPKHTHVLRLLKDAYLKLEDWKGLTGLLPELKRLQAMKDEELQQLELQCHRHQLELSLAGLPDSADAQERLRSLSRSWQAVPQPLLRNPLLINHYADLMIKIGAEVEVEKMLRDLIKRQWDEHLVRLYGRIQGEDAEKQLNVARGWLKQHSDSADLELTLGRLCMRNAHWGKAISHFERSLELRADAETARQFAADSAPACTFRYTTGTDAVNRTPGTLAGRFFISLFADPTYAGLGAQANTSEWICCSATPFSASRSSNA
jgi:HemY protein